MSVVRGHRNVLVKPEIGVYGSARQIPCIPESAQCKLDRSQLLGPPRPAASAAASTSHPSRKSSRSTPSRSRTTSWGRTRAISIGSIRRARASRTTVRLTENCRSSALSAGGLAPGRRTPSTICARSCSTTRLDRLLIDGRNCSGRVRRWAAAADSPIYLVSRYVRQAARTTPTARIPFLGERRQRCIGAKPWRP